jgi:AraC-like DNA-binding protein
MANELHASTPDFISRQVREARRFYQNLRPSNKIRLSVVCGGWERCSPDFSISREFFPYYGLEFVVGGKGRLLLDDQEYSLSYGIVFTYGGGVRHEIITDSKEPLVKYFVDFAGTKGRKLLESYRLTPGSFCKVAYGEHIQKAFEDLLHSGQQQTREANEITNLYLEVLLATIKYAVGPTQFNAQKSFLTFERCKIYMESNFIKLHSIQDAAKMCDVDAAYMCRLFNKFANESPHSFLQRIKMNYAANLLESGGYMVRNVADLLTMDAFHFSRVFKRVHGLSPTAFVDARAKGVGS